MPKTKPGVRSPTAHRTLEQMRQHYKDYQGTPEQLRNQSERHKARRMLEKEGLVRKNDGKDVDHVKPIRAGGTNARSNLRVLPRSKNRGWRDGV